MNSLTAPTEANSLPELVYRASQALAAAATAAEVLDAKRTASLAYDAAKAAARFAKAKGAHDELIAAVHRAQADALEIEAQAKRRLADEYDAAQERGEVAGPGGSGANQHGANVPGRNVSTVADLGLTRKAVHEARQLRDAEAADPGVIRRTLDKRLARGEEPTKAAVREAVSNVIAFDARPASRSVPKGVRGERTPTDPTVTVSTQTSGAAVETKDERAERKRIEGRRNDLWNLRQALHHLVAVDSLPGSLMPYLTETDHIAFAERLITGRGILNRFAREYLSYGK